jgi:RNA polymerase sigma-70 factor (ECF subfamily)
MFSLGKNEKVNDIKLIEKTLAGDEIAFDFLVRKYHGKLISLIYQIIGSNNEAEDIAQEIFIKIFYKLNDYNPQYPFYSWLYRITVNKCYDYLRHNKRKHGKSFDELNNRERKIIYNLIAPQVKDQMLSLYESDKNIQNITRMLWELEPKEKKVLIMRDLDALSYKKMSKILECSELAARLRVFKARKRLRTKVVRNLAKNF